MPKSIAAPGGRPGPAADARRHSPGSLPCRDLPERFGLWQTVYDRFGKWRRSGVYAALLEALQVLARQGGLDQLGPVVHQSHISPAAANALRVTLQPVEHLGVLVVTSLSTIGCRSGSGGVLLIDEVEELDPTRSGGGDPCTPK